MSESRITLLYALLCLFSLPVLAGQNQTTNPCPSQQKNTFTLSIGYFRLCPPSGYQSVRMFHLSPVVTLDYPNGSVMFRLLNRLTFEKLHKLKLSQTGYRFHDIPTILFTGKLSGKPANKIARKLIKSLQHDRQVIFANSRPVRHQKHGTIQVWSAPVKWAGWNTYAMLTDTRYPDWILEIKIRGMKQQYLNDLLAHLISVR